MHRKSTAAWHYAGAIVIAPLYIVFLAISSAFALCHSLFRAAVARRAPAGDDAEDLRTPPRSYVAILDAAIAAGAYLVADMLRCALRQHTTWPEHLDGYGSTIGLHLAMMIVVAVAWPLLLAWIGWYRPVVRTTSWKVANALMASFILALFMGSVALVVARDAYPRMQIACFGITLPLATALVRGAIDYISRHNRRDSQWFHHAGPAW